MCMPMNDLVDLLKRLQQLTTDEKHSVKTFDQASLGIGGIDAGCIYGDGTVVTVVVLSGVSDDGFVVGWIIGKRSLLKHVERAS